MIGITGANGLLGSFILRKLVAENLPIVAIKRDESDISLVKDINHKIVWRTADVTDPIALNEALAGVTHLIHTAALVSFNPRDEKKIFKINVEGTQQVVDACLTSGVKRLIHISSVAALGRQKNQTHITEENKWIESTYNSIYAESKYKAELEIFRGQEEGLSTVIINPSVILGPANWDRSSSQLFKYVWQEKKFYIDGKLNYVDVRDVASIVCKLIYTSIENQRFIISAGQLSFKDFFDRVAGYLNKMAPSVKLSNKSVKLIALLEDLRSILTGSNPLITKETARLADTIFTYDNTKIKNALNFEFQSVDDTLKWCCEYYCNKINEEK